MVFMKKENIECADCDGYDGGYCDGGWKNYPPVSLPWAVELKQQPFNLRKEDNHSQFSHFFSFWSWMMIINVYVVPSLIMVMMQPDIWKILANLTFTFGDECICIHPHM